MEKYDILKFFEDLKFDELNHKYSVEGKEISKSVSAICSDYGKKADFDFIAGLKDRKLNVPKGTHKQLWEHERKFSATLGHKVHHFGELYPFYTDLTPRDGYEQAIVNFWGELPDNIKPVIMELRMYHKTHMYAGTADIILQDVNTGKYIIADYKTNKDLYKNYKNQKLLKPFDEFLDTPYSKYQIQLNLYRILFEQTGYEVDDCFIVHLKPDGEYIPLEVEDMTSLLKDYE